MRDCIIVAAGDISEKYFRTLLESPEAPYIIAVDGGYSFLEEHGVRPSLCIGDYDSLGFIPEGENTVIYPARKDRSDLMLAIDRAGEEGYKTAFVLGALGGLRPDHSVANLQNLIYALPMQLFYLDDRTVCFAVRDGCVTVSGKGIEISDLLGEPVCGLPAAPAGIPDPQSSYLSLFTQEKAQVTLSGTAYDGENIELTGTFPLGLSNELSAATAEIRIKGTVLIMLSGSTK